MHFCHLTLGFRNATAALRRRITAIYSASPASPPPRLLFSGGDNRVKISLNPKQRRVKKKTMWFLCVFYHRLLDYRRPEVESLAQLFGAFDNDPNDPSDPRIDASGNSLEWRLPQHYHPDSPFHFVNLPSEEIARNVANRSMPLNPFLQNSDKLFSFSLGKQIFYFNLIC